MFWEVAVMLLVVILNILLTFGGTPNHFFYRITSLILSILVTIICVVNSFLDKLGDSVVVFLVG